MKKLYARITTSMDIEAIKTMLNKYDNPIEIKPSKIHNDGVFATQDIKKGDIFSKWDTNLFGKMNDLSYHDNNLETYSEEENIVKYTNVAIIVNQMEINDIFLMFGIQDKSMAGMYFIALKDINKGEELSRVYGSDYWEEIEFFDKYPDNRFRETGKDEDLPPDWLWIDTIRPGRSFNFNYDLYGKKVVSSLEVQTDSLALARETLRVGSLERTLTEFEGSNRLAHEVTLAKSLYSKVYLYTMRCCPLL